MSYPAIMTDYGRDAWRTFLKERRCLYCLDESLAIKNPGAKISKRILGSKTIAPYIRELNGTPISNSPFDVYNQFRFLDPDIWKRMGLYNFTMFKQYFGIFETWKVKGDRNRTFEKCVAYRNLNELYNLFHAVGSRVLKEDVLDLPPKLYSKRYFDLSPEAKRLYDKLKDEILLELAMGEIPVMMAMVRRIRLQQIACGFLPSGLDDGKVDWIGGKNARLETLLETCEPIAHPTIIWTHLRPNIEIISRHPYFRNKCVVIDGTVTGEARGQALDLFKHGKVQYLVANQETIGVSRGQTLTNAKTVIYYTNNDKLDDRLQSEDRPHRVGLQHPVDYIDIVANNVEIDQKKVDGLRKKVNVSCAITGDNIAEWI
jgi:SNF2 family DNA or RNA helicase